MATTTAARAASTFPVRNYTGGGILQVAYGTYALAANPTAADIIQMCRVPAGAAVLGGWLRGQDIDTGSGTLDIDVGWAANGGAGTYDAVSATGLVNSGALNGTAVTNYLPEGGFLIPFQGTLASAGVITFTAETIIQITVNTAANAFTAGQLTVVVFFSVD